MHPCNTHQIITTTRPSLWHHPPVEHIRMFDIIDTNGLVAQWLECTVQFRVVRGSIPCEAIYCSCGRPVDALYSITVHVPLTVSINRSLGPFPSRSIDVTLDWDALLTKIQHLQPQPSLLTTTDGPMKAHSSQWRPMQAHSSQWRGRHGTNGR